MTGNCPGKKGNKVDTADLTPVERLKQHGIRFRFNGIPLYSEPDDWGEVEVVGRIEEPRWTWASLTPEQQAHVLAYAEDTYTKGQERDPKWFNRPRCLQIAYEDYGIACNHPEEYRLPAHGYGPESYICAVCTGAIIKRPEPKPRYSPQEGHIRTILEEIRGHGLGGIATFKWADLTTGMIEVGWLMKPAPLPMLSVVAPVDLSYKPADYKTERVLELWRVTMKSFQQPEQRLEFYGDDALVKWWLEDGPYTRM